MPRLVRKVVLYVCTIDGSVHTTQADARATARKLMEKQRAADARKPKARGRQAPSQTNAILRAVRDGHRTAADIRRATKVRPQNVHPLLHALKRRKLVTGKSGSYALTAAGRKRVA